MRMSECFSKTRLYRIFMGIKSRCYNKNDQHYKWYGGKGIKVCDEWMCDNGVKKFAEWALNNGYNEKLTIDRIDADCDYCPENCRWIDKSLNSKLAQSTIVKNGCIAAKIEVAIILTHSNRKEIAKTIGMTLQKFNHKLNSNTFTQNEILLIAKALNAKLKPYGLLLADGTKV